MRRALTGKISFLLVFALGAAIGVLRAGGETLDLTPAPGVPAKAISSAASGPG